MNGHPDVQLSLNELSHTWAVLLNVHAVQEGKRGSDEIKLQDLFRAKGKFVAQELGGKDEVEEFEMYQCNLDEFTEMFPTLKESISLRIDQHESIVFCFNELDEIKLRGTGRWEYDHVYPESQFFDIEILLNQDLLKTLSVEKYNRFVEDIQGLVSVTTYQRSQYYDPNEYEKSFVKYRDLANIEGYIRLKEIRDKE